MTNWLTLQEAAKYLKMGRSTLYDRARKGNIPAHKMGREWRFNAEDRITMLPASLKSPRLEYLNSVKRIHERDHERDLADGWGRVLLPDAIDRK